MWRAPLAGLASLAMVATMGVAASTANAAVADHAVSVDGVYVTVWNGESLEDAFVRSSNSAAALDSVYGYTVDGKAYNPATPVEGDATVKAVPATADTVKVKLNLSAKANSAQMVNGKYYASDVTLNVKKGTDAKLSDYYDIKDAFNGYKVTEWTLTDGGQTVASVNSLDDVLAYPVASSTGITVTPKIVKKAAKITFTSNWASNAAHYVGSWTDRQANPSAYGAALELDGVEGDTLNAPTYVFASEASTEFDRVSSWADSKGSGDTVDFGGTFTVGDNAEYVYEPADVTTGAEVSFDSNGGSYIAPKHVDSKKQISDPGQPTRDGYQFLGWKISGVQGADYENDEGAIDAVSGIITRFDGVRFLKNVTLTAQWTATYDIRVTFHYGDYEGAPKDVTATHKPSDFLTEPDTPTREGYIFKGWYKADGNEFDFNNTLVANGASNANFVLTAQWQRAYTDDAENALNYVVSEDFHSDNVNPGTLKDGKVVYADDSDYFTGKSWDAFYAQYKKAYQAYESAKHNAVNGEIDSKTAADVVNTLTAAWKDLRFTSANADTVLNGKNNGGTAKVIYRLNREAGLHHLLSGDETEVLSLSNANFGPGNWTRDDTTFRTINTDTKDKWVKASKANTDLGFVPLVTKVTRLYNAQLQEHMYTSDANEIKVLTDGDWTEDSNEAAFYVPALYTTKTKVVRLYNPSTHLHLYTSDTNEVNVLTTKGGWTLDGDAASFYAL